MADPLGQPDAPGRELEVRPVLPPPVSLQLQQGFSTGTAAVTYLPVGPSGVHVAWRQVHLEGGVLAA